MFMKPMSPAERAKKRKEKMAANKKKFAGRRCRLCHDSIKVVDYKDIGLIQKLNMGRAKIGSSKRSGMCARHQRMLQSAVKRARVLALLPFVD